MRVVIDKSERFQRAPQALLGSMHLTERLLKSRGLEYIDLDSVVPELPDSQSLKEKLGETENGVGIPASTTELLLLKEALADLYEDIYNRRINPEKEITITPGSKATVVLLCLGLVNPTDVVALPDPGLSMYRLATVVAGATPWAYTLLEKNDYLPNISALFEPPPKNLKLVFLNYPHNPTGAEAELYFYRDLIHRLRYDNILIVLDSPYCGLSEPPIELPLQQKRGMHLFLELHSFGFPYGLGSLGFAIGHRGAITNLEQIIQACGFHPTKGQIEYALIAIEHHDELSGLYINSITVRRKLLTDGLKGIGWKIKPSRLTPFVWAKNPPWATSVGFARKIFARTGVRVRPGTDFGENGEGHLRLSLTVREEKISKAIENIRQNPAMFQKRGG
jgi:LL-diaminopimelate aminotransferase